MPLTTRRLAGHDSCPLRFADTLSQVRARAVARTTLERLDALDLKYPSQDLHDAIEALRKLQGDLSEDGE
jgi:hypothetical protein